MYGMVQYIIIESMKIDFNALEGFEWDKGNLKHIRKHDVDYRECEETFLNKPLIVNEDDNHSQAEERFRVYGQTNKGRLMSVIFMVRNNKLRVISARDQSKKERREYEKIKTNT